MALNIGTLQGTIDLDDRFSKKLSSAGSVLGGFSKAAGLAAGAIGIAGAAAGAALAVVAKKSLEAAISATESENLFEVSFGNMADAARTWSEELSEAVGTNEFKLREQAATLFLLAESMGETTDSALGISTSLVELSGDLDSFLNLSEKGIDPVQALQSGLVGNTEALRSLNVFVNQAQLETIAWNKGIAEQGVKLTQNQKFLATYEAILQQTAKAQGDLARTVDSPANALRIMGQRVDQISISIGTALLPAFAAFVGVAGDLVKIVKDNEDAIQSFITGGLVILSKAFGVVLNAIALVSIGLQELRIDFVEIEAIIKRTGQAAVFLDDLRKNPLEAAQAWKNLKGAVAVVDAEEQKNIKTIKDQTNAFTGLIADVTLSNEKFQTNIQRTRDATDSAGMLAEAYEETGDAAANAGVAAEAASKKLSSLIDNAITAIETPRSAIEEIEFDSFLKQFETLPDFESLLNLEGAKDALAQLGAEAPGKFSIPFKEGLSASLMALPQVIVGAIQGGGDVFRAVGAQLGGDLATAISGPLTDVLSKSLGKSLGGAIGGLVPGLGGILGGLAGGLFDKGLSAIGGLFSDAEVEVNDLRDSFFEAEGGFEALQARLSQVTSEDLVKQVFDAETVDQFQAAVNRVNDTLNLQGEAQAALQEATERYGFTIEELGPAMQRQQLEEQAGQLLQDFNLLTASGIDVTTVIDRMGGSLLEFVETAKATGQAVPEAMRPVIDELIKSGQLVDANGEAFTSAEDAGISFAQSMSEQFQTLIERIDSFVSAITGIDPKPITIPVRFDTPRGGAAGFNRPGIFDGEGIPEFAEGGIVTSPTLGIIGEAGPEAVVPLDRARESMTPSDMEFSDDAMASLARVLSRSIRDALLQVQ